MARSYERAYKHIGDLNELVNGFVKTDFYSISMWEKRWPKLGMDLSQYSGYFLSYDRNKSPVPLLKRKLGLKYRCCPI
jgi:hypothetical protein